VFRRLDQLQHEIERNRALLVQPRIRELAAAGSLPQICDAEFSVCSQWGEDGIIQYLLAKVPIAEQSFVEFGVADYRESNTRFLLQNNGWRGLVIDSSREHIDYIRVQEYSWRYELTAICAIVTRANINTLIASAGFSGEIGLLSVDIDGNDYWVWEAISVIAPQIVIAEYNSVFGPRWPVSVPYSERFDRTSAHYSNLYHGASLGALCYLAERKGYVFVGSNRAGNNAFFVRADQAGELRALTCAQGYVESRLRESRDRRGRLTFVAGAERRRLIADQAVVNVQTGEMLRVRDL
jgi:hypothetical protein